MKIPPRLAKSGSSRTEPPMLLHQVTFSVHAALNMRVRRMGVRKIGEEAADECLGYHNSILKSQIRDEFAR